MSSSDTDVECEASPDTTPPPALTEAEAATPSPNAIEGISQSMYDACSNLFIRNRINAGNAFQLPLASNINENRKQTGKRKDGVEGDDEAQTEDACGSETGITETSTEETRKSQKQKKFIGEDFASNLTADELQNLKFVARRKRLKKKFDRLAFWGEDFDYVHHFMEPGDTHPLRAEEELEKMKESVVNPIPEVRFHRLDFLRPSNGGIRHVEGGQWG